MKREKRKYLKLLLILCSMVISMSFTASASVIKEIEDNGTFARANKITFGMTIAGTISAPGDEDYYKFSVTESGKIKIRDDIYDTDEFESICVSLYDEKHRNIYTQEDMGESVDDSFSVTPGSYYVRIMQGGIYDRGVKYSFRIDFSKGKGTYRGADNFSDFQKAKKISLGKKVYGRIISSDECKYYKFTIPQEGMIEMTCARDQDGYSKDYWNTSLYNSRKEIISPNRYYYNRKERIGLDAGTYYIKVSSSRYWSADEYYIMIEYKRTSSWERELNNTFDRSTEVQLNALMYGSINEWSDIDCYKFTVPKDCKVKFDFYTGGIYKFYATVYDASFKQTKGRLLQDSSGMYEKKIITTISLKKGQYYLKINCDYLGGVGEEDYRFQISVPNPSASIKLNRTSVALELPKTKTAQLKATVTGASQKVTWKSSNTSVATVSSTGKVTAKKWGKAVITAKANGKTAKCTVNVKEKTPYEVSQYLNLTVTQVGRKLNLHRMKPSKTSNEAMPTGTIIYQERNEGIWHDNNGTMHEDNLIIHSTQNLKNKPGAWKAYINGKYSFYGIREGTSFNDAKRILSGEGYQLKSYCIDSNTEICVYRKNKTEIQVTFTEGDCLLIVYYSNMAYPSY